MSNFIYVIGEQQTVIIPEKKEVMDFTRANMEAIETEELFLVISNVFAKGEFFPGPQEVLTSIIHEVVRRWETYQQKTEKNYCSIITTFQLLDGQFETTPLAIVPIDDQKFSSDDDDGFYALLLETLPSFQEKLSQKAYSPDSRLISIIKDSAVYHRDKKKF